MTELRQDLTYALRLLRRAPGFTAVAIATLALGVGGTTAIFTIVDSILLRPLRFAESQRLTFVWTTARVVRHRASATNRALGSASWG